MCFVSSRILKSHVKFVNGFIPEAMSEIGEKLVNSE